MRAYVVKRHHPFFDRSKRIGDLHDTVFGGVGDYRSLVEWEPQSGYNEKGEPCAITRPPDWSWPAVTNANREPLHITRSGRFVPHVFGRIFTDMIVSPEVREAFSSLPHVGFNAVVFEHLVDLPMPELGDFSWYERKDLEKYDLNSDNLLRSLPYVPELEKAVEGYRQLLPANLDDVADRYNDIKSVPLDFGSYNYEHYFKEMPVSQRMLKEYPIIQSPHFLFRDDAFALIAPFLDLDYYAIAVLNFDD